MVVPSDCKRKAAFDLLIAGFCVGSLQGATGEHGFLKTVKRNGAKLLPVTDELIFDNDLVDCKLALI